MTRFGWRKRKGFPLGVLVDEEDLWLGDAFTWRISSDGYVCTSVWREGKQHCLMLHRAIMWPQPDEEVDHRFHNKLDNRRHMLQCVTYEQNNFNRKGAQSTSSTGVLNVHKAISKAGNDCFHVRVAVGGKVRRSRKVYKTVEEAAVVAAQFREEARREIYA
jgi:hypothetical protein